MAKTGPCIRCGAQRNYAINGNIQDLCYDCAGKLERKIAERDDWYSLLAYIDRLEAIVYEFTGHAPS